MWQQLDNNAEARRAPCTGDRRHGTAPPGPPPRPQAMPASAGVLVMRDRAWIGLPISASRIWYTRRCRLMDVSPSNLRPRTRCSQGRRFGGGRVGGGVRVERQRWWAEPLVLTTQRDAVGCGSGRGGPPVQPFVTLPQTAAASSYPPRRHHLHIKVRLPAVARAALVACSQGGGACRWRVDSPGSRHSPPS